MNFQFMVDSATTTQSVPNADTAGMKSLDQNLSHFRSITLQDMDDVALLDRTDTKMLLTQDQLYTALHHLTTHYRVLEIERRRRHHYQTLYFDTPDLDFYHQHHNGKRNRYKVRERAYIDSNLAFVEVKHKTRSDHTIKHRKPVSEVTAEFGAPVAAFVRTHMLLDDTALQPTLWNAFQRITLVSTHCTERVTLDVGLRFYSDAGWVPLSGVAIAEVKQARFSYDSDFMREMRYLGIRPASFSKYCTGISMLYPNVKYNAFKPCMLTLDRLMRADQRALV